MAIRTCFFLRARVSQRINQLDRTSQTIPQRALLYFRQRDHFAAMRKRAELSSIARVLFDMERYSGKQREALVAWAEANPRVRRVWVFGGEAGRNASRDTDLDLAIELAPVVDGDESLALWIASAEKWQDELERSTGSAIDLDWYDPEIDAPLDASAKLAYERAQLRQGPDH
jgi:predicted nucleotidyltransferase